jgi:hypothetical protein
MNTILNHVQRIESSTDMLWNMSLTNHEMIKEVNSMLVIIMGNQRILNDKFDILGTITGKIVIENE